MISPLPRGTEKKIFTRSDLNKTKQKRIDLLSPHAATNPV